MRLAIVGSTGLGGNETARATIRWLLDRHQPDVVVSGGANGIDTMAADEARKRGILVKEYLPLEPRWRGAGGFRERNLKIAHNCDRLARIVAEESTTYGSGWTRDRARECGVPCEEYTIAEGAP